MSFNDSLSDMLARIKNAHKANKSFTHCYNSKLNINVLAVLKDEGGYNNAIITRENGEYSFIEFGTVFFEYGLHSEYYMYRYENQMAQASLNPNIDGIGIKPLIGLGFFSPLKIFYRKYYHRNFLWRLRGKYTFLVQMFYTIYFLMPVI